MKNCLILGFGRSGTSLMGGILSQAGYYMGDNLYPPRPSNPKGFFENNFINNINEEILAHYDYSGLHDDRIHFDKPFSPFNPSFGQRWLSYIDSDTIISKYSNKNKAEIISASSKTNFSYKDPRFNYTFVLWDKIIHGNIVFICVFRKPDIVVESVLKECSEMEYLSNFYIDDSIVYKLWYNNYSYILKHINRKNRKRFLFVNYDQLYINNTYDKISNFINTDVSSEFFSQNLNRTKPNGDIPIKVSKLYKTLNDLSLQTPKRIFNFNL